MRVDGVSCEGICAGEEKSSKAWECKMGCEEPILSACLLMNIWKKKSAVVKMNRGQRILSS